MLIASSIELMERGLIPDSLTRWGIRQLFHQRMRQYRHASPDGSLEARAFLEKLHDAPVAVATDLSKEQHYELPADFFCAFLGPRRKYSCCYFETESTSLQQAEEAALRITCDRAQILDGQKILELGCGWGSLTLFLAERFPNCKITAVSHSSSQRNYILEQLAGLRCSASVEIITADMTDFQAKDRYDRIVSVEMFEHMRNYPLFLRRLAKWLHPDGLLFIHFFCHQKYPYLFESEGAANWMGRYFFTGGTMPSFNLFRFCQDNLQIEKTWTWNGQHYARTLNAWLANFDRHRPAIKRILDSTYGPQAAHRWFHRWRLFLIACAELFAYREGNEWFVAHYLMRHSGDSLP